MTMIVVNINEVKAKLSEYLEAVARGERVLICKRNRPVAELCPVATTRTMPRPTGGAKGQVIVPPSFFEPLPDDLLDAFEGKPSPAAVVSRVAEQRATYGATPPRKRRR